MTVIELPDREIVIILIYLCESDVKNGSFVFFRIQQWAMSPSDHRHIRSNFVTKCFSATQNFSINLSQQWSCSTFLRKLRNLDLVILFRKFAVSILRYELLFCFQKHYQTSVLHLTGFQKQRYRKRAFKIIQVRFLKQCFSVFPIRLLFSEECCKCV